MEGGEAGNNQDTAAAIERTEPRLEQQRRQQQLLLRMVPGEQHSICWGRRCRGAASARGAAAVVDAGGEDTGGAAADWIEKVLPGRAAQQAGDTKPKRKSRAAKREPTDAQLAVQLSSQKRATTIERNTKD